MRLEPKLFEDPDLLPLLCFRNPRHALKNVQDHIGRERLIAAWCAFAGSFIRFPPAASVITSALDLDLLKAYRKMRSLEKLPGHLDEWRQADSIFMSVAKKLGLKHRRAALARSNEIRRELGQCAKWHEKLDEFERRVREREVL